MSSMVRMMRSAIDEIEGTEDELKKYASVSEDARILMSIKGISALTAMTILSAIDGIYRFETPESLVSYFGLTVTHKESAGKKV